MTGTPPTENSKGLRLGNSVVTTDESMYTIVVCIHRMTSAAEAQVGWHRVMASTMLAMLPPVAVVVVMQRWFVKGLVETEK